MKNCFSDKFSFKFINTELAEKFKKNQIDKHIKLSSYYLILACIISIIRIIPIVEHLEENMNFIYLTLVQYCFILFCYFTSRYSSYLFLFFTSILSMSNIVISVYKLMEIFGDDLNVIWTSGLYIGIYSFIAMIALEFKFRIMLLTMALVYLVY